jgi:transcriptional regulator with XRE-family HTH domain
MSIRYFPVIDMVATGRNIMALRKARGLSVSDLQEYFGFEAPQAIYKWQKGQTLPSTDNLFALSHLLGVSIEDILIPAKARFQILPREESCGSHLFGDLIRCLFMPVCTRLTVCSGIGDEV